MDLWRQFFDGRTYAVLGGLFAAHILAALLQHHWLSLIPVLGAGIAAFLLSLKRLEWGIAFAFLEIFTGGHGHLFDLSSVGLPISLRIAIFLGIMIAFGTLLVTKRVTIVWNAWRDIPWLLFGLAVALGAIIGFAENDPQNAFDDFNSYLPILYILPIVSVVWDNEKKRLILMTLAASAVWVASSTLFLLFAFTHLPGKILSHLYTFVRDARLAEITILTAPDGLSSLFPTGAWYFRIFEQGQIVILAFLFIFAAATYFAKTVHKRVWLMHALLLGGIYASLSRSFAIGAVCATGVVFLLLIISRVGWRIIVLRSVMFGLMKCSAILLLWLLIVFPLPLRPDFTESPFYRGGETSERDLAVSSRWNLLPPLVAEIWSASLFGSGFGEEVTFISDDPRVRAINGTGEWTTYRFEWGYHDLWLKTGILGILAIIAICVSFVLASLKSLKEKWIMTGMLSMILFVLVVHVFTPYLNHPLGIALLLLPVIFLSFDGMQGKMVMSERLLPDIHPGQALGQMVVRESFRTPL